MSTWQRKIKGCIVKQNIRVLLLTPIFLASSLALGRDPECRTMQINLGPTINYAHYEFGCDPNIRGALAGLHFDFEHIKPKREYVSVRFDGRWNAGSVSDCFQEKNQIRDYRTELDLGYNHIWCEQNMRLTPFVGVGFLYFSLEAECASPELKNRYYNVFVPVGFKYEWTINDCFSWGALAEYRIDAWTRLKVNEECGLECERAQLHPRTQGLLIEMPFTWFGKESVCHPFSWQVKVVPYFDWNRFGGTCESDCISNSCTTSCVNPCSSSSSCTTSCSNPCSSSSSCSQILCPFDPCESTPCDVSRLNQWYVGAHVDLGIRF